LEGISISASISVASFLFTPSELICVRYTSRTSFVSMPVGAATSLPRPSPTAMWVRTTSAVPAVAAAILAAPSAVSFIT
jgi:hypothetical protein